MSLINEALRHAKNSDQVKAPPPVPQPMRPVETAPKRPNSAIVLSVAIVLLLVLAGVFIGLAFTLRGKSSVAENNSPKPAPAFEAKQTPKPADTHSPGTIVANAKQPAKAPPAKTPDPTVKVTTSPSPATAQTAVASPAKSQTTPEPATTMAAARPSAAAPANIAQPKPAMPVLRGIYFNPTRPSAVLNTRSVLVGDIVSGFRVTEITKDSVTVTSDGKTNVLTLTD
jgi:hypothetical protein